MRNKFDAQLALLGEELTDMGAKCESAIAVAAKALMNHDEELARRAIELEVEIDRAEHEIEALCMRLLLQQQPVARDLRLISAALRMITDMERIGDQASDIAEIMKMTDAASTNEVGPIGDMARATIKMVTESVESFVKKDLDMAQGVIAYDDVVDDLFDEVKKDLVELMKRDAKAGEYALDLLLIAKYFERIGDHATNIAEWVEYSITGVHRQGLEI